MLRVPVIKAVKTVSRALKLSRSVTNILTKRRFHIEDRDFPEFTDMELKSVTGFLQQYAPPSLAGSWDNVGLLIEPTPPHQVNTMLLTNDLTPAVLEEAIQQKVDLILSYHPPLFVPIKRITQRNWKEKIVTQCIENRIAVYSPHTSYDALEGGINDWLISAFELSECKAVEPTLMQPKKYSRKRVFTVPVNLADRIKEGLSGIKGVSVTSSKMYEKVPPLLAPFRGGGIAYLNDSDSFAGGGLMPLAGSPKSDSDDELVQIGLLCNQDDATAVMEVLQKDFKQIKSTESYSLDKVMWPGYGMGRVGKLKSPITVEDAVKIVKEHLSLKHVRLARAEGTEEITSVAVCAGSGSSVLKNVPASLYVTGEMSHHEVLHAVCNGTNVILCDHSNTERGYLSVLQQNLDKIFKQKIKLIVSSADKDPLEII